MIECIDCGIEKDESQFGWRSDIPNRHLRYCKPCHTFRSKLSRYRVTKDQFDAAMKEQGGVCAICKKDCLHRDNLSFDHDHATGKFRGLLCHNCNVMLGNAKDSISILQNAIAYLTKS